MMHAASREALATLRERLDEVQGQPSGGLLDRAARVLGRSSSVDRRELAGDLYAVSQLLVEQPRLRRAIGDPASSTRARSGLVDDLLRGKIGDAALDLTRTAAEQRWSSPWDLTEALDLIADDALLAGAEDDGRLDEVEDELFRFGRILDAQPNLVTLLDEAAVPGRRRAGLLDGLLDGKVSAETQALLVHAVTSQRKRSIELAIDALLERAAARRERSIARVTSAVQLTEEQESRLAQALGTLYGRRIAVRTAVDPTVRGGLVIKVGDEVIDGSVASRFAAVRKGMAG